MNDPIQALRDAVKVSPDNVPLRQHLADSLLTLGRFAEAELEYRQALALDAGNAALRIGLGRAYYQQNKNSQALVIVEDMPKQPHTPAAAYVLHARLLLRAGEVERAVRQYKEALEHDPTATDAELAAQLGVRPAADDSEVFEGKVRASWEGPADDSRVEVERPALRFDDVGGMDGVKDEIRMKIILPLKHPELYQAYGNPGRRHPALRPAGVRQDLPGPRDGRRGRRGLHRRRHQRRPRHVDRPKRAEPARDLSARSRQSAMHTILR
jgi:transitional endoplasmic reticulum ATPase